MKKITFCVIALAAAATLQSCSKDEKNCSSSLVATYNGTTDCQNSGSRSRLVTIQENGVNQITISNILLDGIDNIPLKATVSCEGNTITIPKQEVAAAPDPTYLYGSGTFTSNSVSFTIYKEVDGVVYTATCRGTYVK